MYAIENGLPLNTRASDIYRNVRPLHKVNFRPRNLQTDICANLHVRLLTYRKCSNYFLRTFLERNSFFSEEKNRDQVTFSTYRWSPILILGSFTSCKLVFMYPFLSLNIPSVFVLHRYTYTSFYLPVSVCARH